MTRKSIYRREDLLALVHAHRPVMAVPDDPPSPGTETSIATLHGELEKRTERRPASAAVIADDLRVR